jgi:CRISPR system Cascade subunit CasE
MRQMNQLYLTRLTLNPRSREARRDAASAYELHCTLRTRLFASAPQEAKRALFRMERDPDTGISTVLVQSHAAPDFSTLPPGYWLNHPEVRSDYAEKLHAIAAGQFLRFRLLANPTVKQKNADGKPARYGLYKEAKQRAWLTGKLSGGAKLIDVEMNKLAMQSFRRHGDGEQKQTHFAVLFEGILQVADPDKLRQTVESGIGSAKGFGFGLLSLAPA